MDLAKLGKKAFFIPTPGQTEQEYLAKKFDLEGIAPSCKQSDFKISELEKVENFIGFNQLDSVLSEDLFDVFRVKENSLPTAISLST
jgi:hypothetical protein